TGILFPPRSPAGRGSHLSVRILKSSPQETTVPGLSTHPRKFLGGLQLCNHPSLRYQSNGFNQVHPNCLVIDIGRSRRSRVFRLRRLGVAGSDQFATSFSVISEVYSL